MQNHSNTKMFEIAIINSVSASTDLPQLSIFLRRPYQLDNFCDAMYNEDAKDFVLSSLSKILKWEFTFSSLWLKSLGRRLRLHRLQF